MESVFNVLLVIHIAAGGFGLITGTINLVNRKGDQRHKRVGKLFFYSMMITGFSSLGLAYIHNGYFLFIVGIFTIYLTGTGERYLRLKGLAQQQKPLAVDWFLTLGMLLFGIIFIALGGYMIYSSQNFGIVLLVFGFIGLGMVRGDISNYKGKDLKKNFWLAAHITRMVASYIGAMTAFIVVNNTVLPGVVAWMLPTVVLTPLIIKWRRAAV